MTNAPVKELNSYFMNTSGMNSTNNSKTASDSFSKIMNKTTANSEEKTESFAQKKDTKLETNHAEKSKDDAEYRRLEQKKDDIKTDDAKTSVMQNTKETGSVKENTGVLEKSVSKKADAIVAEVADELDVSKEDVLAAMESLGLQNLDLLNPDNMASLVVTLSGEDTLSLVTDESLYGSLNHLVEAVTTAVEDLQEEFSISDEDWKQIVNQIKQETPQENNGFVKQVSDVANENAIELKNLDQTSDKEEKDTTLITKNEPVIIVETGKELNGQTKEVLNQEKIPVDTKEVMGEETKNPQVITAEEITEVTKTEVENGDSKEKNSKNDGSTEKNQTFIQEFTGKTNTMVDNLVKEMEAKVPLKTVDTEKIMKQIMDYMKVTLNSDVTEMEMQLHPASLGTINLSVAIKNGAMTAQFVAQNEAVKTALESQMVQLKENLEERGVKVEAVEVTVESHAFERNLQQGQQESQNEQSDSTRRQSRKSLVLDGMDSEEELLDQADKLTVKIMQQNGNSVDYSA